MCHFKSENTRIGAMLIPALERARAARSVNVVARNVEKKASSVSSGLIS